MYYEVRIFIKFKLPIRTITFII